MDQEHPPKDLATTRVGHTVFAAIAEDLPPPPIPDHQLLRCIGRGSYGSVWLARNAMGTFRAVKFVHRRSFSTARPFERELAGIRKFEPISRSHEGFLDVLHVGINEEEGCFYYVMELGDDWKSGQAIQPESYVARTLSKEIAVRGRLSAQQCLELGLALSQALDALHKHGLVHRDIKPSNIIFVNGVPKLADIGLVADVHEAASYVGTEGFIPPEGPGTPSADVYSLGKVLYEASTGRDRQDFPELPTRVDQFPDHERFLELNEIILAACKSDPAKRYASAWDMQADLVVLANGKSVRRLKLLERRLSTLKRMAGISALVLAIAGGIGYGVYRGWRTALETRQRKVGADVAYGTRALEAGDLMGALPYFVEALAMEQNDPNLAALHRLRFGCILAQCPKLVQLWSGGKEVEAVGFSPDGRSILAVEWNGQAQVFGIGTGKPASPRFGQADGVLRGAYSPDGTQVVTVGKYGAASVWSLPGGQKALQLEPPSPVRCARFSPDGSRMVTACADGIARIWNAQTGELLLNIPGHTDVVLFADFSPDGRRVVTTSQDETARIVDATTGRLIGAPMRHPTWVGYASFSPDGRKLATACFDHVARVWDVDTGQRIPPDMGHRDGVNSVEFSPDGRLILTAGLDRVARIWLADTHQPLTPNPILRHSDRVTHAAFAPDGHRIVTACVDGTVRIWDLAGSAVEPVAAKEVLSEDRSRFLTMTNAAVQVWDTLSGQAVSPLIKPQGLQAAALNQNGAFVLTRSLAGPNAPSIEVWDSATGHKAGRSLALSNDLSSLCLSLDGARLLVLQGTSAQTWDVRAGRLLVEAVRHTDAIGSGVFNPAATQVATCSGNFVKVWDPVTGRDCFPALRHHVPTTWAEFSPDGSRLVTCSADQGFTRCQAQIWSAATGQPLGTPLQHDDGVISAMFSSDGRRVSTASEDFTAAVWDALTGKRITPALKHDDQVWMAAFSANGKWLATASADKSARVWSAETGDPLTPPLWHRGALTDVRFLRDGAHLVTSNKKGAFWKWELPSDPRPVEALRRLARLLSANAVALPGEPDQPRAESLDTLWRSLSEQYPKSFAASADEVARWQESEAEDSEHDEQWFAAAFHLRQLLALQPGDSSLHDRLTRAEAHVRRGDE